MDFALVFKEVAEFFVKFCETEIVFNGLTFTVGSLYVFLGFAFLIIVFLKRMGD